MLDFPAVSQDACCMDLDDLFAKNPTDPLVQLTRQDLDPLSVEELDARRAVLEAEIARIQEKRISAVKVRASADALFRK